MLPKKKVLHTVSRENETCCLESVVSALQECSRAEMGQWTSNCGKSKTKVKKDKTKQGLNNHKIQINQVK